MKTNVHEEITFLCQAWEQKTKTYFVAYAPQRININYGMRCWVGKTWNGINDLPLNIILPYQMYVSLSPKDTYNELASKYFRTEYCVHVDCFHMYVDR